MVSKSRKNILQGFLKNSKFIQGLSFCIVCNCSSVCDTSTVQLELSTSLITKADTFLNLSQGLLFNASEEPIATIGVAKNRYDSSNSASNATKIWGSQTFTTPVVIEAETSIVD